MVETDNFKQNTKVEKWQGSHWEMHNWMHLFFFPWYLFVVICLLSCGWSCYALSMINRRNARKKKQRFACTKLLIMCQLWSVPNVSGMVAQTRGHSASCAFESAIGSTTPCSLPWCALVRRLQVGGAETAVMRILFFTNCTRARLLDGRISNQKHLKIMFSNSIQSAPEWSNF